MREYESNKEGLFSYFWPEARVPADHPLRAIRVYADEAAADKRVFSDKHADSGPLPVSPENLLKSSLLMALYSVRSERPFREMFKCNLLFRWSPAMGTMTPPSIAPPATPGGCPGTALRRAFLA
jgi:transposase